jgi:hypothetical protein
MGDKMTNFEFKVLQFLQRILMAIEGAKATPRGTVRDVAGGVDRWQDPIAAFLDGRWASYEEAHKEATRRFVGGSSSGGVFSPKITQGDIRKALTAMAALARDCDCGWADKCSYPAGLCPVKTAGVFESPSPLACRIMFPLAVESSVSEEVLPSYDVISRGPGMEEASRDVCECGHVRSRHVLSAGGCTMRFSTGGLCECAEFNLRAGSRAKQTR